MITRRAFLVSSATAAVAAAWARPSSALAALDRQTASFDVDALFNRSIVIDALSADENWAEPDPIFAAYKVSGLTMIHTSLANANFTVAMRDLASWQTRFDRWPDRFFKLERGTAIAEAKRTGRLGVLLGFQNGTIVDSDVANVDKLYAAGTRCIQLTYNEHNLIGDGCTVPKDGGVSAFGRSVIERMNHLGIVVDLSHCGLVTSKDGVAISQRPPAFTHTMCAAVYDHVRAKPDALLKAMADKGGMIGIASLGYFVGPTPETSLDDYLTHIQHAVTVAGIDHVGVASDYSIRGIEPTNTRERWYVPRLTAFPPEYRVRWPPWIKELDPPERYRTTARGLANRGFTSAQVEKILGGNWARYFTEVLTPARV